MTDQVVSPDIQEFPDNAQALFAVLRESWGEPVPVVQDEAELARPGMVFQFGRPPNRIDLPEP